MVHQPELVVGEGVPRVLDRHRTGEFAAIGIALVHGDAAEVVLELFHRIDNGSLPVADARIQSAAWDHQQREAGAGLLVANANVTPLMERHGNLPQTAGWQKRTTSGGGVRCPDQIPAIVVIGAGVVGVSTALYLGRWAAMWW